jgi:FAD/FMN-containing dehydrogenase
MDGALKMGRYRRYQSWSRYSRARHEVHCLYWRDALLPKANNKPMLPYGNGRSYGDSCLNDGGVLLDARGLDRFINFDPATGLFRCEAGILLADILALIVPQGWFLPVTPGTRYVTVGGVIANDVHGKNHHRAGTFGCHVRCFEILRSNGQRLVCSPEQNADWFRATIGGLGLTGVILWAEIALKRISNPYIDGEIIRFRNLERFFELTADSDRDYEYTVAWLDCLARGRSLGRGLFTRGNHAAALSRKRPKSSGPQPSLPVELPFSLVNKVTLRLFNSLYYHKQLVNRRRVVSHYEPFFYPLDGIHAWNRLYGPRGFLQYQCVVPPESSREALGEILNRVAASRTGSFLAVLKGFGQQCSPGMLSFPRPGVTLALDFPNRGKPTLELLDRLDEVVEAAGGAIYPAKDARMSGRIFRKGFPEWKAFSAYIDPASSSSFWRRVMERNA